MSTITRGGTTVTPADVFGSQFGVELPTIQHVLLDGTVRYTIKPALPREGTLGLLFVSEASAMAAFNLHKGTGPLVYVEPAMPSAGMTYLVTGRVDLQLEPETSAAWMLTVPYKEVL